MAPQTKTPWRVPRWAMPLMAALMAVGAFADSWNNDKVHQMFFGFSFAFYAVSFWLNPLALHAEWRIANRLAQDTETPASLAFAVLGSIFLVVALVTDWST